MDTGMVRVYFGVPRGYRNPPGKYWAYMGLSGERGEPARGGARPLQGSPNRTRRRGYGPLSLSLSFLSPPMRKEKEGGSESY